MASRVGKYKLSKRETALSIIDGGVITGAATLNGTVTLSSNVSEAAGASLTSNQVYYTSSLALSSSALNVLVKG